MYWFWLFVYCEQADWISFCNEVFLCIPIDCVWSELRTLADSSKVFLFLSPVVVYKFSIVYQKGNDLLNVLLLISLLAYTSLVQLLTRCDLKKETEAYIGCFHWLKGKGKNTFCVVERSPGLNIVLVVIIP